MNIRPRTCLALLALPLLLAACGTSTAGTGSTATATSSSAVASTPVPSKSGMTMADGMVMAPGEAMATASEGPAPATATMVCGPEIQGSIKTLLALPGLPKGTSTWSDALFTCTYVVPQGQLVLSVQQSTDAAAANSHFTGLRSRTQQSTALTGLTSLGLPAFQSTTGIVAFVKDNLTLEVDASGLAATVGPQRTSRSDFAYTVATDVLACWQE